MAGSEPDEMIKTGAFLQASHILSLLMAVLGIMCSKARKCLSDTFWLLLLTHYDLHIHIRLPGLKRDHAAVCLHTVDSHGSDTLLDVVRILDCDVIYHIAEPSGKLEIPKTCGHAWIDA